MKHYLIVLLLIITLFGCSGCMAANESKNSADINQKLRVTAGRASIKSVSLINYEGDALKNNKEVFKFAFENNASADIKYIKKDKKITLDFGNTPPDNVSVKDILLTSEGGNLYSDKLDIDIPLVNEGSNFSFYLKGNPNSMLSSQLAPNKIEFRGFKITASWGDKEYWYAFVIKSDK
ncbi:MAG: hypothetical protein WBL93_08435 [Lutisporaceae bacterium]